MLASCTAPHVTFLSFGANQVGWYNELVLAKPGGDKYTINAPPETLALVIVSSPLMWTCFKKSYAVRDYPSDPVDTWCRETIEAAMATASTTIPSVCVCRARGRVAV